MSAGWFRGSRGDMAWLAAAGAAAGAGAAALTRMGNPIDGGISIACFLRDLGGALGAHPVIEFSYVRPELVAIAFGALGLSLFKRGFRPRGGSLPAVRFLIGVFVALGVFVFVGCPMRAGLRLAGGDPSAVAAFAGLCAGAWEGSWLLKNGYYPGKTREQPRAAGILFHVVLAVLLALLLVHPQFLVLARQRHAPLAASLAIGAAIGALGQHSKLCFISGIRNVFLIKDLSVLAGSAAFVVAACAANIFLGQFHPGVHIIGSSDFLWSFLAMVLVGLGCVLLGGCPFRQLVLAAQGNSDSMIALAGIALGAAAAYKYNLSYTAGSVDPAGKTAVIAGIVLLTGYALLNARRMKGAP
jgi:YedE family putative selenium metabolism protein